MIDRASQVPGDRLKYHCTKVHLGESGDLLGLLAEHVDGLLAVVLATPKQPHLGILHPAATGHRGSPSLSSSLDYIL